ncbi:class I SAM-dependent methyltransferase [Actinopolymorpha rutila]|uniref:tRNA (Cmo5U34)-methyltransferase n=1 Tax=Actinopolymorpha rutila TaxID=446787 RepID=A0A852ZQK9_9ACTN|nr:tRNA (cmo5U34)-methyltransferase [Actinopolymorpha rutila]
MNETSISNFETIEAAFGAAAGTYDSARRRLVPCFDDFYGTALRFATLDLPEAPRVLDLGAGTGLFSALVAGVRPRAELTLVDSAAPMLAEAASALSARGVAHEIRRQDLAEPLPHGQYDAVISALAIHHLDDDGKRDLYRRILGVLTPGGVFVNAEQVAGPTSRLDELYDSWWEEDARARGSDDAELAAARARMAFDRPATAADQVGWLREAGFADAACPFAQLRFAVLVGWSPS